MPLSDKIMNIFKKITIKSPKTKQDIKLSSALTSDDPLTKKVGVKKAKDIIRKAKDSKKEPQEKPKEKPNPEYEKAVQQAKDKAEKMAKDNPIVTQPIQDPINYKYYYPGEEGHYRQTGFDPAGQFSVKKSDFDKPKNEPKQKSSEIKPIKDDADTKRMGDSIQRKIGGSKDPNRLKLKGTQTASNGETIIQYEDSDDGSMVGVDAQGNIYEDGEKQNYGVDVSTQSDVFGDDQNAQLLYKQKKARETGGQDPFARTEKLTRKEAREYVKENKEKVLKYVIKKIIKEELDAS